MYCNKCGNEIINGSEFCSNCGTRIGKSNSEISRKKIVIGIIIIIAVIGGLGVWSYNNIQNDKKQQQEQINKKVQEEMRDIQDSKFDNPSGSFGQPSTYRISPDQINY